MYRLQLLARMMWQLKAHSPQVVGAKFPRSGQLTRPKMKPASLIMFHFYKSKIMFHF
jgi:hypothetical protein